MDWETTKWIIGDIGIPVILFILGFFIGRRYEKRKTAKSKIRGDHNTVFQNVDR